MADTMTTCISDQLEGNEPLAMWLYLLGVAPEQFDTVFHRPEYRDIDHRVPAYHRYAVHLRHVLEGLADEDVYAFIKLPREPRDNAIYGYLYRLCDGRRLTVGHNGVDGIHVSNAARSLLGGIPPVDMDKELAGNWYTIDKAQRDLLFQWADSIGPLAELHGFERVTGEGLTPERLRFLADIARTCIR